MHHHSVAGTRLSIKADSLYVRRADFVRLDQALRAQSGYSPDVLTCCNMVDSHAFRQRAFSPALWILTPGTRVSRCNFLPRCATWLSGLLVHTFRGKKHHSSAFQVVDTERSSLSFLGRAARAERLLPQIFSVSSISLRTGEHVSMSDRIKLVCVAQGIVFQLSVQHPKFGR